MTEAGGVLGGRKEPLLRRERERERTEASQKKSHSQRRLLACSDLKQQTDTETPGQFSQQRNRKLFPVLTCPLVILSPGSAQEERSLTDKNTAAKMLRAPAPPLRFAPPLKGPATTRPIGALQRVIVRGSSNLPWGLRFPPRKRAASSSTRQELQGHPHTFTDTSMTLKGLQGPPSTALSRHGEPSFTPLEDLY